MLFFLLTIGLSNCTKAKLSEEESFKEEHQMQFPFKLYSTENMWTFIKLDTRNGKMWQVQYSIEGDEYRLETSLNPTPLSNNPVVGRFELYTTQNMYNFVLLDRISGATWQVQWSIKPECRVVYPIE